MTTAMLADGTQLEFPDGTNPDVISKVVKQHIAGTVQHQEAPTLMQNVMSKVGGYIADKANMAAGAVRGAGSIGATITTPYDLAMGNTHSIGNPERRQAMDAGLQEMGADPTANSYKGGKIATEMLGASGLGPLLGVGAKSLPIAAKYAQALSSGGFTLGDAATASKYANAGIRAASGAVVGGASSAAIDPESAGTGAAYGAVLPNAIKALGGAGSYVKGAANSAMRTQAQKLADKLVSLSGMNADEMKGLLNKQGPNIVNAPKTVPQLLQSQPISQLARTAKTIGAPDLVDAESAQNSARMEALSRVGNISNNLQDTAQNTGNAIRNYALPAEAQASSAVSAKYNVPQLTSPDNQLNVPIDAMQNMQSQYLGPGTFGTGKSAQQAIDEANHVSRNGTTPNLVPFQTMQNLRSSLGESIQKSMAKGDNKEAAAMTGMINVLDNHMESVAMGKGVSGENFPMAALESYGNANAAHAAKMNQFHTGPQAGLFNKGGDGLPALQGAEIPPKFFNSGGSQVADMQSFNNLIGDNPSLASELKNYGATKLASSTDRLGTLTNAKFNKTLDNYSGALKGLFDPSEMATIKGVGDDVHLADQADELGRVKGGSDTAQKQASILSNGMLDSKLVDLLANKIPITSSFTSPILSALRKTSSQDKATLLSQLLTNPQELSQNISQPSQKFPSQALDKWLPLLRNASPALSNRGD